MKPNLTQLKAAAQLAGMAYQADPQDHKLAAWEKAEREFDEAEAAEAVTPTAEHAETVAAAGGQGSDPKDEQIKKLEGQLLLKDKEIEKLSGKLAIFESAKKTTPPGKAPAKAASKPAAPAAAKAAAPAATPVVTPAAPTEPTVSTVADDAKKNS